MAKQVNKPFLITLTLIIAVAIGGGFFGLKWIRARRHETPAKLIEMGNALMADKRPEEAANKFGQATVYMPNNPLPISLLGDALYELSKTDPEYIAKAMSQWDSALQIDPNFKPALKSKLNKYIDDMDAYQRTENFVQVRDTATRLAKLDPTDTRAVSYRYIATLSAWMNNQQTSPDDIREAMDGLRSLAKADPSDATMPYQVARGLIQQAQDEARTQGNATAALARYAESGKVMDDAVAQQPGNIAMLLRAGQIYAILDVLVPKADSHGVYDRQSGIYLDRARSLVHPEDKNYEEVQTVYASRKLQRGDHDEAERVYRDLLQKRPDDVPARLVLAEILQAQRSTRKEAADLLARTVADGEKPTASRTAIARALQLRAMLRLAAVRMDLLEDATDPTTYKESLKQIEADVAKAESKMPENPESLKVHGRLYLIKGDVINAVQSLTKAVQMLDQVAAQRDYELLYTLARAQLAAQQNEKAKNLLTQIVAAFPTYAPARSLLVEILLNSNDTAAASSQIDELEKQMPGSPVVTRYRLLTLDGTKDKAEIDRLFVTLPQDNRQQILEKARIGIVLNRIDDAIKLLELAHSASPSDTAISDRLARLYLYKGNKEQAKKVLDGALVLAPKDAQLLILRGRIDNATPKDLMDLVEGIILGTADPFSREMQLADLERLRGNGEGLYKHLVAAEKLAPNDSRVQEQLFTYYLATRQWDAASKYIDPLTKSNYGGSNGLIYRWKLAVAKQDYATAVQVGREFTQKMPEFATSWITLGQALKLSGQYEEGLRCFYTALENQSANRDAIRGAIDCLYQLQRYSEAKGIITSARKLFPNDLGLAEMELEFELTHGDPKNAMTPLLTNLTNHPDQIVNYLNVATLYYRMSEQSTVDAEKSAYLNKGIDTLKVAIAKFPDEMQPYINLAELQSLTKDRPAAEATLKQMCDQPKLKDQTYPKVVLAEFYLKGNQPDLAEKPLRDAVAVAPKSVEIRRKLAVYLAQRQRVDDALTVLDAAPDRGAFDPVLLTARLEILVAAGRYADAESAAGEAIATKPNNAEWIAIQSNAQLNQAKYDEAIATAQKALAIDPKNNRALITRAMAKMNRPGGDLSEAIHDLETYRDQNPLDNNIRRLLADAYTRRQRPDDATRELEIAVHNVPGDRQARTTLLEAYRTSQPPRWSEGDQLIKDAQSVDTLAKDPDWLTTEATWWVKRHQNAQALAKIRAAIALAPQEQRYVQAYLSILLDTKNESQLLKDTDAMIAADPTRWWIYESRGLARKSLGDAARAEQEFRQAVTVAFGQKDVDATETAVTEMARQVGPDKTLQLVLPHVSENVRYLLAASSLYLQSNDQADCLKLVDSAMGQRATASPLDRARILNFAGAVYSGVKPQLTDKAYAAYQELIGLQPENPDALNQLAWLLAVDVKPIQPQQALVFSSKAYKILSDANRFSPTVFDTHGWVLVLCGKSDDGISILRRVVDSAPTIESYYHLGAAYLQEGKNDEAQAQLAAAKQLMDTSEQAKVPVDGALKQAILVALDKVTAKGP